MWIGYSIFDIFDTTSWRSSDFSRKIIDNLRYETIILVIEILKPFILYLYLNIFLCFQFWNFYNESLHIQRQHFPKYDNKLFFKNCSYYSHPQSDICNSLYDCIFDITSWMISSETIIMILQILYSCIYSI